MADTMWTNLPFIVVTSTVVRQDGHRASDVSVYERLDVEGSSDATLTLTLASTTSPPIARVVALRYGSVTHGFNFDQRLVELSPPRPGANPDELVVGVDASAPVALLPPGPYMLFAISDAGVPSVGWRLLKETPG